MVVAPMNSIRLRSAIDTDAPTADLIWVVSAVSRDTSSPLRAESKNAGRQRDQMREHVAPEIGDDALADRHDQIEPRRAGAGQHRDHRDHHAEIAVDHARCLRALKPKSIMRRTAIGTTSVVIAATVSEMKASNARPR